MLLTTPRLLTVVLALLGSHPALDHVVVPLEHCVSLEAVLRRELPLPHVERDASGDERDEHATDDEEVAATTTSGSRAHVPLRRQGCHGGPTIPRAGLQAKTLAALRGDRS